MLTTKQQDNNTVSSSEIQAIILLYGWIGATPKQLQKYAKIYSNHKEYKCVTICDIASTPTLIIRNGRNLTSLVINSVRKVVGIIRQIENERRGVEVPVILHYFSNGGAFVVEHLDQMVKEAKKMTCDDNLDDTTTTTMKPCKQTTTISEHDANDLITVSERLQKGFEVLDSTPSYLDIENTDRLYKVLDVAIPPLPLRVIGKGLLFLTINFMKLWSHIVQRERVDQLFWNHMIESDLCPRQAFVYSTKDELTDSNKVDEFINLRKKRGIEVTVVKFEDSISN